MFGHLRAAKLKYRQKFLRAHGHAEVLPLHGLAVVFRQVRKLRLILDALRHDVQIQAAGNGQNESADRRTVLVASEIHDEAAVDLEHVNRKLAQIIQAGVTRTEIVDG